MILEVFSSLNDSMILSLTSFPRSAFQGIKGAGRGYIAVTSNSFLYMSFAGNIWSSRTGFQL